MARGRDRPPDVVVNGDHNVDVTGGDYGDEELPEPRRRSPSARRLAVGAAVTVVAVLIALAVVRSITDNASSPSAAGSPSASNRVQSSPSASAGEPDLTPPTYSPVSGAVPPVGSIPRLPFRFGPDPRSCPGHTCVAAKALPAAVVQALRDAFPGVRVTSVQTIVLSGGIDDGALWFRQVVARRGARTVRLRVQAHTVHDVVRGGIGRARTRSLDYIEENVEQWHVLVRVTDSSGRHINFVHAGNLATDERVVST